MHLEFSPSQDALRAELREYFAKLMSPEVKAEIGTSHDYGDARRRIMRQMGSDGWLGIGWPKEYGGQGRSEIEQFIFFEEAQRADAPVPFVTLNTVGPTLIEYGSDEHKQKYLPGILAGELAFAIGYSEAEAGTDLASLSTKAIRDGDEWLINGAKMWTSGAVGADYVWLACRTDPDVKKHKGISIIIVPTDIPGFSVTPIVTVGSSTTTATYYDDVRVPYENLVSDLNSGWRLITTQLNHERIGLAAVSAKAYRVFDDCLEWAKATDSGDGTPMIAVPWVAASFGACHARLEAMRTMNQQMAADVRDQKLTAAKASSSKVMGTETLIEVYKKLLEVVGAAGPIRSGSPAAILMGDLEDQGRTAQINTFGGGVNEVQREIIAWMGLGMTRTSRR